MADQASGGRYLAGLALGALGVVYGDIGTSPLYALRECFHPDHGVQPVAANVLGVLSLIIWSLVLIVCVKYVGFVLRADNKGEGGILALLSLTFGESRSPSRRQAVLLLLGIFGAALLYGDGVITPCITVLGAIEGLEVATPVFIPYIVPLTIVVLLALFSVQRFGTGGVGKVFGPVMLLWFVTIGVLGVRGVLRAPEVLASLSPWHGVRFLMSGGYTGFVVIGAVFLALTGAEALYADLGHFGARPIRLAWFALVFPALILNYLGQGALVLREADAVANPFYRLAPPWGLYPLVILATAASVIASQALIAGAFSITMQAIQLGYLPRMEIRHTSWRERGQIYLPLVNVLLLVCCIGLVLGFQSSSRLAGAYGIAVTLTMLTTTLLFYSLARRVWSWSLMRAGLLCALFFVVEAGFFAANAVKIPHGGWFPLLMAAALFTVMSTWKTGRRLLGQRLAAAMLPLETFLESLRHGSAVRVKGTAVYMAGNPKGAPIALLHNLKHNRVLHERVVLLTMVTAEEPRVAAEQRVHVESFPDGFHRVTARFGFMETPGIGTVLEACRAHGLEVRAREATFFLSRETVVAANKTPMAHWRKQLFAVLARNAQSATAFFGLPTNRVVELGMQVEL